MSFFDDISNAILGWLDLLGGSKDPTARFKATREGLLNALVFYAIVFVGTLAVAVGMGTPATLQLVLVGIAYNVMPLVGVAIAILATKAVLRLPATYLTLFVPASYAMAFVIIVGLPLSLYFGNLFSNAMLGLLGFMLYRLGRILGGMKIGPAIAFAALSVLALVLVPVGTYMLIAPAPPAA